MRKNKIISTIPIVRKLTDTYCPNSILYRLNFIQNPVRRSNLIFQETLKQLVHKTLSFFSRLISMISS